MLRIAPREKRPISRNHALIGLGIMLVASLVLKMYAFFTTPRVVKLSDSLPELTQEDDFVPLAEEKIESDSVQPSLEENPSWEKESVAVEDSQTGSGESVEEIPQIPEEVLLDVPFMVQAPTGVWDDITEETCEEASLAMVLAYKDSTFTYEKNPEAERFLLLSFVARETALGMGPSISLEDLAKIAQEKTSRTVEILENPSEETLARYIAAGNPIIVPALGRQLQNPFFSGEGPVYHMLVLRGYTATTFIANDPGTRHGEAYQYPRDRIMKAIADWHDGAPNPDLRRVLVVK